MAHRPAAPLLLVCAAISAAAQGLPPRPTAEDYSVRAHLPNLTIAADYLGRVVPVPSRPATLNNYLVLEIAVYPTKGSELPLSSHHFSLRINGRNTPLLPQVPALAAAELKYPDWEPGPRVAIGAGIGDATVVWGPAPGTQRFPGDPRSPRHPAPSPQEQPLPPPEPSSPPPDQFAREAALPEGHISHPVAGLLYFAFKGKTRSVRRLELIYSGPAGSAVLRLF